MFLMLWSVTEGGLLTGNSDADFLDGRVVLLLEINMGLEVVDTLRLVLFRVRVDAVLLVVVIFNLSLFHGWQAVCL